ncbi:MAG: hypothetical protein LC637_02375 [Xanthomonadaceae bacterium]|nr:hypothetical protein [Xanthomonadaceae bacterium]
MVNLRWFIISGCLLLLVVAVFGFELLRWSSQALVLLFFYALGNAWVQRHIGRGAVTSENFFRINLIADLVVIYFFISLTGGSSNPFTLLFLLPVIVAAATLHNASIWIITGVAIGLYSLLLWQGESAMHRHAQAESGFDLHIIGMWLGLVGVAGLVAYFAAYMGRALLQRERQLAAAREKSLRDERVVALGALAAGTAHQLGTPLSTMAIVLKDLGRDHQALPESVHASIDLLADQLQRCKQALAELGVQGHDPATLGGRAIRLDEFPMRIAEALSRVRPQALVEVNWQGPPQSARVLADLSIEQAVVNLIGNAIDAAPEGVELTSWRDNGLLVTEIRDRGPGLSSELKAQVGKQPFSTKDGNGLGIGLLLAHAVVERLGGSIDLQSAETGGTRVRVSIPLAAITIDSINDPA